jgi:hypothetical protein
VGKGDILALDLSHDVADVFKHLAHQCNGFGLDGLELQLHAANDHSFSFWLHSSTAVVIDS